MLNRTHYFAEAYRPLVQTNIVGDAREDLVGALRNSDEVHVLRAVPGGWADAIVIPTPPTLRDFQVADLNNDEAPELIVSHGSDMISVFAGSLGGSFGAPQTVTLPDSIFTEFQVGDVDADGNVDLVLALGQSSQPKSVTVLPGDGLGGFGAPRSLATVVNLRDVQLGQLDGTPALEILSRAASNQTSSQSLDVLRFDPASGLQVIESITTPTGFQAVQLVDVLDEDGLDDLVAFKAFPPGDRIWARQRLQDGTFAPELDLPGIPGYGSFQDIDRDGRLDLVGNSSFARGLGGLTFGPFQRFLSNAPLGLGDRTLFVRDMDEDGNLDLLKQTDSFAGPLLLTEFRGRPNGDYERDELRILERDHGRSIPIDVDGDGFDDLVDYRFESTQPILRYIVRPSDGSGGFGTPYGIERPWSGSGAVPPPIFADLNGDGRKDLITRSPDAKVYFHLATRTFGPGVDAPIDVPRPALVGDIDGDGREDIVAQSQVLWGDASGLLVGPVLPFAPFPPLAVVRVALGDVNGDGRQDVAHVEGTAFEVFLGRADRTFAAPVVTQVPPATLPHVIADFDGDQLADAVVSTGLTYERAILRGQADGSFTAPMPIDGPPLGAILRAADVDGDGALDIYGSGVHLQVFLGRGDATFGEAHLFALTAVWVLPPLATPRAAGFAPHDWGRRAASGRWARHQQLAGSAQALGFNRGSSTRPFVSNGASFDIGPDVELARLRPGVPSFVYGALFWVFEKPVRLSATAGR